MDEKELAQQTIQTVKTGLWRKYRWPVLIFITGILTFVAGLFIGIRYLAPALTQHHYTETKTVVQPTIIQGEAKTNTLTEIQYVEKPVLVYKDPATGEIKEQVDPTDVRLIADPAKVNVMVNGKPYAFDLKQGETQKFQNGQLVLDQSSAISFKMDVQPTIIDNTASGGIDVYAGNKDAGIGIRHKRIGLDIGKDYKNGMEYRLRWQAVQFK